MATNQDTATPRSKEATPNPMATSAQPTSFGNRLFNLPTELRDEIFKLAISDPSGTPLIAARLQRREGPNTTSRLSAIIPTLPARAVTCRQAYTDVAASFYQENTFKFRLQINGHRSILRLASGFHTFADPAKHHLRQSAPCRPRPPVRQIKEHRLCTPTTGQGRKPHHRSGAVERWQGGGQV